MPKIITAVKVENKTSPSDKHYQVITDGEGIKYSSWGEPMEQGIAYEIEDIMNGKYHNIKSFTKVADKLPVKEPVVHKEATEVVKVVSNAKDKIMILSYAKDMGVALVNAGKECSAKKVTEIADEWIVWYNK